MTSPDLDSSISSHLCLLHFFLFSLQSSFHLTELDNIQAGFRAQAQGPIPAVLRLLSRRPSRKVTWPPDVKRGRQSQGQRNYVTPSSGISDSREVEKEISNGCATAFPPATISYRRFELIEPCYSYLSFPESSLKAILQAALVPTLDSTTS